MPSTEQMPLGVNKIGEDRVEIQEGLGETTILDLKTAKLRLENIKQQKDAFTNQELWQKQIDASKRAVALLEQADSNKKETVGSKIGNVFKKVRAGLIK